MVRTGRILLCCAVLGLDLLLSRAALREFPLLASVVRARLGLVSLTAVAEEVEDFLSVLSHSSSRSFDGHYRPARSHVAETRATLMHYANDPFSVGNDRFASGAVENTCDIDRARIHKSYVQSRLVALVNYVKRMSVRMACMEYIVLVDCKFSPLKYGNCITSLIKDFCIYIQAAVFPSSHLQQVLVRTCNNKYLVQVVRFPRNITYQIYERCILGQFALGWNRWIGVRYRRQPTMKFSFIRRQIWLHK